MALIDEAAGVVVTAAPGTGSTALLTAWTEQRETRAVPAPGERDHGVDAKHGTVTQLVAAGLLPAGHGLRVVTTTRNPYDFYVAEHVRTRTRWVQELRDPGSWVHRVPGAIDRIVDAVTLDFPDWVAKAVGDPDEPRRLNRGHVEEADVVLRMEHLEADVRDHLGVDLRVAPTNVTDRDRAYWRAYDAPSRRLVEQAHAADLALFGYVF